MRDAKPHCAKNRTFRLIKRATEGNRTLDPPLTNRLLCRLSYGGVKAGFFVELVRDYTSPKRKVKLRRDLGFENVPIGLELRISF